MKISLRIPHYQCSQISDFICVTALDGASIGQNFLVLKFMKGIYNKSPPQLRYQDIWDLDKVFSFIDTLDTDDNLSLKFISKM